MFVTDNGDVQLTLNNGETADLRQISAIGNAPDEPNSGEPTDPGDPGEGESEPETTA